MKTRQLAPILLSLLFLLPLNFGENALFGQFKERFMAAHQHIELGAGTMIGKLRDEKTSPLLHSGMGGYGNASYLYQREKFIGQAEVFGNISSLRSDKEKFRDNSLVDIMLNIKIEPSFYINEINKTRFFAGPMFQYNSNQWIKNGYSNSSFQYLSSMQLGVNSFIQRNIYFKGKTMEINGKMYEQSPNMRITYSLTIPFFGLYVKPMHHGFADISNPDADLVSSDSIAHVGSIGQNMVVLDCKLSADYIFRNGNALRLSYWWKYHGFKTKYYNVDYAMHGLSLAILFRLDRNTRYLKPKTTE